MVNDAHPKRVLILHDYGGSGGGAELVALDLRRLLRAKGIEAQLMTSNALPWVEHDAPDQTCNGTMGRLRSLNEMWNFDAARMVRNALRDFRPDVVHINMFMTQLSPSILPVLKATPTVYGAETYRAICPTGLRWRPGHGTCHRTAGFKCQSVGCLSPIGIFPRLAQMRLLHKQRSALDALVVPSQIMANLFAAHGWTGAVVVPHAVPLRKRQGALSETPVIAFAGRLVEEKGVAVLLRAFAVSGARLKDAILEIIGDGPERPRLEALAQQLGITNQIRFTGHVSRDESESRLDRAWVQVVPSLWPEPFGLVAAEALGRGTAVIASDAGGPAEIVDHDVTGLVVRAGDVGALSHAIEKLLNNRDLARSFGAAGEIAARETYGQDKWVAQLLRVYSNLLLKKARAGK
jgi:glycosyltransferase involved in cell wall biosynthesis